MKNYLPIFKGKMYKFYFLKLRNKNDRILY